MRTRGFNFAVDEVQFPRAGDTQNLTRKVSMQSSNLRDDGVGRQVLEEDASVRHDETMVKVFLAELRSRLDQALAPKPFLLAGFFQLNTIAQFPWNPGTKGAHHPKPFGTQPTKPLFAILVG